MVGLHHEDLTKTLLFFKSSILYYTWSFIKSAHGSVLILDETPFSIHRQWNSQMLLKIRGRRKRIRFEQLKHIPKILLLVEEIYFISLLSKNVKILMYMLNFQLYLCFLCVHEMKLFFIIFGKFVNCCIRLFLGVLDSQRFRKMLIHTP